MHNIVFLLDKAWGLGEQCLLQGDISHHFGEVKNGIVFNWCSLECVVFGLQGMIPKQEL